MLLLCVAAWRVARPICISMARSKGLWYGICVARFECLAGALYALEFMFNIRIGSVDWQRKFGNRDNKEHDSAKHMYCALCMFL